MTHFWTILGMALITFLIRFIPYAKAGGLEISPNIQKFLGFTPVAVLTAIVVPSVLKGQSSSFDLSLENPYWIASICALAIALYSKNLLLTIALGMLIFLGLAYWL